ncbi:MAG: hypothetical protein J1G30_07630 [Spirochaetales bacterium]|nr:hypothetical protein [Spirochaetales bacterium]
MWLFLVIGIFFIYQHTFNIQIQRKTKITLGITSAFFAAFTVVGILCEIFERWIIDSTLFFILMTAYFAYFFIIYAVLKITFYYLFENNALPPPTQQKTSKLLLFFDNHTFACTFLITVLCWLPLLVIFYPGSAVWDGFRSLTYFFGYVPWSNHHPVPISLLMGSCMKIGKMLGSNNLGLFIYNIFQVSVSIITFCNIQLFLKKIKASYILRIVTVAYFALFPLWRMSYMLMKDPLYCMIVVNFTIELAYIILNSKRYANSKYRLIYLTFLCICTCFTRNNGVYILFFAITVLVVYMRNKLTLLDQIKLTSPLFIGIFLFSFCIHFLYPSLNIGNDSKQESKSVFCQQIGRYLKYYSDDLTEKEKDMLSQTFADWENIGKIYNPVLSDPIKNNFLSQNNSNKLMQLWLDFFIKNPAVYFEAFFYQTAGYYSLTYENNIPDGGGCGYFPHVKIYINKILNPNGDLNAYYPLNLDKQRKNHNDVRYFIKRMPLIGLLFNAPLYTYIMVLCFIAVILYRQKKKLIIFIPSIVTFLVALASPVNGSLRYFLPVLAITPILIGITLMKEKTK